MQVPSCNRSGHVDGCPTNADDATRRKTEQDIQLKRSTDDKFRELTSHGVFDRIGIKRVEPRVSTSQLTLLTKTRAEILNLHKDVL